MIGSLVELVRFLERAGMAHRVRQQPHGVEIASPEGTVSLCWDGGAGRLYAVRWDEDEARASLRLSIPMTGDGALAEQAVVRLLHAAIPGEW